MVSQLEDLPNEIIANMMEYISTPSDIYRAFTGQNHRFDSILRLVRLSIDLFHDDKQTAFTTDLFSSYCDRLRLLNICPSISLVRFSRLRSLTVIEPTESQVNSIRSGGLPMLNYLATQANLMIFECLFGDEQQRWHHLRSCCFLFAPLPSLESTWQPNHTLRTLSGVACSRETLSRLLTLTPSLKHLRIDILSNDKSNWKAPLCVKNLVSLRMGFHRLVYEDLPLFLRAPLQRLYIEIYNADNPIDFVRLGDLFASKSLKLKQFNLDYQGTTPNLQNIRTSHPFFKDMMLLDSHSENTVKLQCENTKASSNKPRILI